MLAQAEISARARIRRVPSRADYQRETIDAILDEALVAHLGFAVEGQPYVIPTLHARVGDIVYIHGSSASRAIRALSGGLQACLTVTLLDGLVLLWAALFRLMAGASRRLRNQAEENRRLAREDGLTGLANRTSFTELAAEALARRPAHAAVLLLDLDRFKDINDSLGHHAGDLLLREIGPRLDTALPAGSVVCGQSLPQSRRCAPKAPRRRSAAARAVCRPAASLPMR